MKSPNMSVWIIATLSLTSIVTVLFYEITPKPGQQTADPSYLPASDPQAGTQTGDPIDHFLSRHWVDPLPPQGNPPAEFSALEASLAPESCARCHAEQYRDWRSSLHSRAMGPGLLWQFRNMGQAQANRCMRCHAPLAEQKALMAIKHRWSAAPVSPAPAYVPAGLHRQGLVCAACHVRRHQRFGPPANVDPASGDAQRKPHGGFTPSAAFQDSRFCANCHQFPAGGYSLNGKLRQNTYEEWRNSRFAHEGTSCQSCHMPGRRHLWRGIHDIGMARQAITLALTITRGQTSHARAEAVVSNTGAGHHFPTYLVPKIYVTLHLIRPDGSEYREIARKTIGWMADVSLKQEIYDTRIPAGGRLTLGTDFTVPPGKGWQVELRVDVAPGEHYERVYRHELTKVDQLNQETITLLHRALVETEATRYQFRPVRRSVPPPPPSGQ